MFKNYQNYKNNDDKSNNKIEFDNIYEHQFKIYQIVESEQNYIELDVQTFKYFENKNC